MTIYTPRIERALQESGEREAAKRRDGIRTATTCGWCRRRLPDHDPRCLEAA